VVALKAAPAAAVELQVAVRPAAEPQALRVVEPRVARALRAAECKVAAQAPVVVLPAVARAVSHLPAELAAKAAVVRRPAVQAVVEAAAAVQ
jgi:hypothetical protein